MSTFARRFARASTSRRSSTQVIDSQGIVATSFVPSASFPDWHLSDDHEVIMDFDVEASKALLDDAGWTEGSDGIREKDGERLEL